MSSLKAAKAAVRKQMKVTLDSLTMEEKQKQSRAVTKRLLGNPVYQKAKRISVFLSMTDEIDTSDILKHSLESGKTCFIPRYDSKSRHMDMVKLHSLSDYHSLPETSWNIKQPPLTEQREDALTTGGLDFVLVPGLAFTLNGGRLGRGRGYYDTFLSTCLSQYPATPPAMVAVAFTQQILRALPTETTDIYVNTVITPDQ